MIAVSTILGWRSNDDGTLWPAEGANANTTTAEIAPVSPGMSYNLHWDGNGVLHSIVFYTGGAFHSALTSDSTEITIPDGVDGIGINWIVAETSENVSATNVMLTSVSERGLISKNTLTAIADAIRAKTETTDKILPADMAGLVNMLILPPDGITEIEVVTCAASGTYTLAIPCGMSDTPVCVAIYQTEHSESLQSVVAGIWIYGQFVFWYGGSSTHTEAYKNASPLDSGVFTVNAYAGSSTARFVGSDYRCVMWR